MKQTTIFFYGSTAEAVVARELVKAENLAKRSAFSRDATTFDPREREKAHRVVIMPGVFPARANLIRQAYGDLVEGSETTVNPDANLQTGALPVGGIQETKTTAPAVLPKEAVHRGGGRWHIMQGDVLLEGGPYSKEEAKRLAAL